MNLTEKHNRNGSFAQQNVATNIHLHPVVAQFVKDAWIDGGAGILDVDFFQDNASPAGDCCSHCDVDHVSPEVAENEFFGIAARS